MIVIIIVFIVSFGRFPIVSRARRELRGFPEQRKKEKERKKAMS
jgi:hypothetical protein